MSTNEDLAAAPVTMVTGTHVAIKPDRGTDSEACLVQIRADNVEIQRRITAFMQKKRADIDELNRREFCNVNTADRDGSSCARTDAVFTPQFEGRSRVKVTRVVNKQGPQTMPLFSASPKRLRLRPSSTTISSPEAKPSQVLPPGVEERLSNMEKHLKISGSSVPAEVYSRIKVLEERILHLESLSPEYFHHGPPVSITTPQPSSHSMDLGEPPTDNKYQNMSCAELDSRIQSIKQSLLQKLAPPSQALGSSVQ